MKMHRWEQGIKSICFKISGTLPKGRVACDYVIIDSEDAFIIGVVYCSHGYTALIACCDKDDAEKAIQYAKEHGIRFVSFPLIRDAWFCNKRLRRGMCVADLHAPPFHASHADRS